MSDFVFASYIKELKVHGKEIFPMSISYNYYMIL